MTRRKINRISLLLLLIGFGAAIAVALTAPPEPADSSLRDPLANKKYLRELRVLGGRANVLAAEFQQWFAALWHGEQLAGTLAVLTVGATLVFRFVATHPELFSDVAERPATAPPPPEGDAR